MSKFEEAYFTTDDKTIKIEDYQAKEHYKKLRCPECRSVSIHIVEKQKTTYFAADSQDKHSEDCQHFNEFIPTQRLRELVDSNVQEDEKRLKFLIDSNLKSALRLLSENDSKATLKDNASGQTQKNLPKTKNSTSTDKKESIKRVHIKNLIKKKDELINEHIVIYGSANVFSEITKTVNGEKKKLIFREKDKFRFSIFLDLEQTKDYSEPENPTPINFAVFGVLRENITKKGFKFLNLEITDRQHLRYLK